MKMLKLLLTYIFLIVLSGCNPSADVAKIEGGVEAELTSDKNFVLDFGEKIISGSYVGVITLSNSGKFKLANLAASPLDEKGYLFYRGGTYPGTNGTCGNSISSGASCTIEFEFRPDHEGAYSYNIGLSFNTGVSSKNKTITVKGYAGSAAFLKFDDASDFDFGIREVNDNGERAYIIKNAGGLTAKNLTASTLDAPFYYKGGSYPGTGGTCRSNLAAYSECTIVIELRPLVNESVVKSVAIDYFNGNGIITFSGSVQALIVSIEADLAILASGVQDFGSATFEKGIAKKFKIMNKGYLDATSVVFAGSSNFIVGTDNCNGRINKSTFCEFNILFFPHVAGALEENFVINFHTGKQNQSISLAVKGKSITPAILSFDPLNVNNFGNQGINSEKILSYSIKNTGDFTATGVTVSSTSTDFIIETNGCLSVMLKNSVCNVKVKFNPTSAGNKAGDIKIDFNNGSKNVSATQTITGLASPLAYLKYADADPIRGYDFGVIPNGKTKAVRMLITNTGLADAKNVRGTRDFGIFSAANFHYRGNFNLSALGRTVSSYPSCSTDVYPGDVCKGTDAELYYNNSNVNVSYSSGSSYPDCSLFPDDLCKLDKSAPNPGIYVFPGVRVLTDYPVCSETIPVGQTCQIVFDYSPPYSESIMPKMALTYINDNLSQTDHQEVDIIFSSQSLATLSYKVNSSPVPNLATGYTIPSAFNIGEKVFATVLVTNDGQFDAVFNSIEWMDPGQTHFSFSYDQYPNIAPGKKDSGTGGSCSPTGTLSSGASCTIFVWFFPQNSGNPLSDFLKINYYDGEANLANDLKFSGVSAGMAEFQFTPAVSDLLGGQKGVRLDPVAIQLPGVHETRVINIKNIGSSDFNISDIKFCSGFEPAGSTACSSGNFAEGVIDNSTGSACLNQTVAVNDSCTFNINYSPQSVHTGNNFTLLLTYTSSGLTIKKSIYGQLDAAAPAVLHYIDAGPLGTTAYDFTLKEYLEESYADLIIENQSGAIPAQNISFSIENDPSHAFGLSSSGTTCTSTLAEGQYCTKRVTFIPTAIGDFTADLKATYFNGKEIVSVTLGLKGTGEAPRSNHKGWSTILSSGNKVNISNVSDDTRSIELVWNAMVPKAGYVITGYNIYRRNGDGNYGGGLKDDYTTPLNTSSISATLRTYKDINVDSGKVYYYEVRPIIMGFPSRTLENTREVRVTVPFDNMVFVHRWMANTIMCAKLGKTIDINNNSRCSYGGIGSNNNFFDVGYDFMVDRYELGTDKTSRPGQIPLKDTQANMLQNCYAQGEFSVFNISKTVSAKTFRKRLLTRKEFHISSTWNPADTDAAIITRESGSTSSNYCNGANGAIVEKTGNNPLCKSLLGIEDAAGNEYEWVSDRIVNGVGITDQMNIDFGTELRLDPENKDLAGIDFNSLIPSTPPTLLMKNAACFTVPLGLSIPLNPSTETCLNARVTSSLGTSYLHDNTYAIAPNYSDMKGLASGGAAYINGSSGIFSSYWLATTTAIGSRCTIKLNY